MSNLEQVQVVDAEKQLPVVQGGMESIIALAVQRDNFSVEALEKLLALWKEIEAKKAEEAYNKAMTAFQAECPKIEKKQPVYEKGSTKVRYKFASLDDIVEQIQAPLGKHGFSCHFDTREEAGKLYVTCFVTHIAGHTKESTFGVPIGTEQYMTDVQKYGARVTFIKRYVLCCILRIVPVGEDNDAAFIIEPEEKGAIHSWCKALGKRPPTDDQLSQLSEPVFRKYVSDLKAAYDAKAGKESQSSGDTKPQEQIIESQPSEQQSAQAVSASDEPALLPSAIAEAREAWVKAYSVNRAKIATAWPAHLQLILQITEDKLTPQHLSVIKADATRRAEHIALCKEVYSKYAFVQVVRGLLKRADFNGEHLSFSDQKKIEQHLNSKKTAAQPQPASA